MSSVDEHRAYAPARLGFGVVTASSSRDLARDGSGDRIAGLVEEAGHRVAARAVVPDRIEPIREAVRRLLDDPAVDVVVVNGGTGISPGDVTPEAVAPLLERTLGGFGELFRALSFEQVGPAAMLSRALAGVVGPRAIFVLPGSPQAVTLALERLILPEATHLVGQLRRGDA